jgi:S1-C subfamily serine protease
MPEVDDTSEIPTAPIARGPAISYSSPFTQPLEAPAAPAAAPEPALPPRAGRGGGRLVLAAVAFVLLVMAASALGAVIAHEFWTTTGTPSALPGGGASSAGGAGAASGGVGGSGTFGGTGTGSGPAGNANGSGGFSIGSGGISIGSGNVSIGPNGISIGNSGGAASGTGGPANTGAIAAKVDPALVDINVGYSYQGGAGAGTGIVVSPGGEVITNNHVIDGATSITATDVGNGRTYTATVVGYDPTHDVAVLQLQGAAGLATARLGDSSTLAVGNPVVGVGNAGGAGGAPAAAGGSITALNQSITAGDALAGRSEQLSGLVQTNADIQAGDSGGPLIDSKGRVIGMDTAGSPGFGIGFGFQSSSGQAFAIPINQAAKTAAQIVAGHGSATVHVGPSAFLGVQLASPGLQGLGGLGAALGGLSGLIPGGSSPSTGVDVGGVVSGEPAAKAGLGAGDVITSLDGQPVGSAAGLARLLLGHHPGDKISLGWTDTAGRAQSASIQLASGPPA